MSGSDSTRTRAGLRPGGAVHGVVVVPTSKSIAQRACVAAALASGTTRISALPRGDDVNAAIALIAAVGADVRRLAPAAIAVTGRPPGPHRGWRAEAPLDAGESGTLARLATAAAAFAGTAGHALEIRARGTLTRRESPALFAALRAAGVRFSPASGTPDTGAANDTGSSSGVASPKGRAHFEGGDAPVARWPARFLPIGPPSTLELVDPSSSQEVSALILALAAYPDAIDLVVRGRVPSRPYLDMTIGTVHDFGARVVESVAAEPDARRTFRVQGPLRAPADPIVVEADASAAAVALCAACLSGGEVRVEGLPARSRQGDVRIVEHLSAFGCEATRTETGLVARGAPRHGAELDLVGEPDLAPVLAVIAAHAALVRGARSRLGGLHTLPGKESSRIDVLASGLRALGLAVEADRASLAIGPGSSAELAATRATPGLTLDAAGDHRMAFAFALMGLLRDGVDVLGAECVAKSWPDFFAALRRAGARVHGGA